MHLLQVDAGREWRGGQNQVRLLARALARDPDFVQRLVTARGGMLEHRAAGEGVVVVPVPWTFGLDPRAVWRLAGEIRRFAPRLVHAHDSHALAVGLVARTLAGARRRTRVVATRRVDFPIRARSPWHRADHVIAISQAVQHILIAGGLPAERISVVASGVDPDEVRREAARPSAVRQRLCLPPGTPLAVNVAALVPHKDQHTLVRAAAAARGENPALHWLIAGAGPLRGELERAIAAAGVADRVHLLGYVPEADALIREADVFVMSSREEGLGSVVLNALALGKPVAATRAGGLPELLPPEALVAVGDAAGLARKVLQALAHPAPAPFPPQCTASAMVSGVVACYRALA